jgi:glutamyl-tRNA reductase
MPSRLSKECRECPFILTCNYKRMEIYAYMYPTCNALGSISTHVAASSAAPALRETIEIHVDDVSLIAYKDEVEKKIRESLGLNPDMFLRPGC